MKILIFWDLYGRVWRKALEKELPILKQKYKPDFTISNIENCTSARWPIEKHAVAIENMWVDLMTSWDHIFDNEKKIIEFLDRPGSNLIRPANFYESSHYPTPWKGYKILEKNWKRLLVINVMSEVLMRFNLYNPFLKVDEILEELKWEKLDGIIVDHHKEYSSEVVAMSYFLDSRVSFVYGTHTHVQTNDEFIFDSGTWFITDVGMVWPFPSVIWADFESVKKRFLTWLNKWKIEQDLSWNYVVNWVCVEIKEGKCVNIEKIRIRNKLLD